VSESAKADRDEGAEIKRVRLSWDGEGMTFRGGPVGGAETVVDGDGVEGPGPMDTLLVSLAGCMAIDVRMILEKSRVPLEALEIEVSGRRATTDPRRFEAIELLYRVRGPADEHAAKLQRAIDLSRETYCSVLHSLRPDIDVDIGIERI